MKYFLLLFLLLPLLQRSLAQVPAQSVPSFTFYTINKASFSQQQLAQNKKLFFFFFDPSCDHCQKAATNLNKQYSYFKNTAVYLVSTDSEDRINSFIHTYLLSFSNKQNVTVLQDTKNQFVPQFNPIRVPAMYLYSEKGKLIDYEDNAESTFRFTKLLQTNTQ